MATMTTQDFVLGPEFRIDEDTDFPTGSIISASLPIRFTDVLPHDVDVRPRDAMSSELSFTDPPPSSDLEFNGRPPHHFLILTCQKEVNLKDPADVTFYAGGMAIGTLEKGALETVIDGKQALVSVKIADRTVILRQSDVFVPCHDTTLPGLTPPASNALPAHFPSPPLAPYIPAEAQWICTDLMALRLTQDHLIQLVLDKTGQPFVLPAIQYRTLTTYLGSLPRVLPETADDPVGQRDRSDENDNREHPEVISPSASRADSDDDDDDDNESEGSATLSDWAAMYGGSWIELLKKVREKERIEKEKEGQELAEATLHRIQEWQESSGSQDR